MPISLQPTSRHTVFVYGTLKRGQSNHHYLHGSIYLGRRRLVGAQLHNLGPYPMALLTGRSETVIHGELYRVNDGGLALLDQLEGYPGYYDRSELSLSDGTIAWTYHGNREQVAAAPVIPAGEWQTTAVLHYGSNLDPDRLQARCHDWDGDGVVAQLEGWSWGIDKVACGRPGYGYAGIQLCSSATTWGVVTHHSADDVAALDRAEGIRGGHYQHHRVRVRSRCGATFEALTYVPCDDRRRRGLQAEDSYRNHILQGLDHWNLPAAWRCKVLESLCTTT